MPTQPGDQPDDHPSLPHGDRSAERAHPESWADADPRCPPCDRPVDPCSLAATLDLAQTLSQPPDQAGLATNLALTDLVGQTFDAYTLESFLGKGGMARVFLARHNALYRPCAIKILTPRGGNADLLEPFLAEARAAASLVHPHVVTVHNIGQYRGLYYIELEYVPGQTLQQMLHAAGRLDPHAATEILAQATSALAEAHRRGLVHRDFKPSNILVHRNGMAKLADFGLAKRVHGGETSIDALAGTPYFMAPELFQSHPASKASDVYAIGVSYYYLLTGEYPFDGPHAAALAQQHIHTPVPDPRERVPRIPDEAAELAMRCLEKHPGDRPANGTEVHRQLHAIGRSTCRLGELVDAALRGLTVTREDHDTRVHVRVSQPHGRSQQVWVEECAARVDGQRLIRIYSICGRAHGTYYRRALELNSRLCHGALGIQEIDGEPFFVMSNSYPRATCDPEEIQHSIQEIARWADRIEAALTGEDQY